MMTTPWFPAWSDGFAVTLRRLRTTTHGSLHQFELLFAAWIPHHWLAPQDDGPHSRCRAWHLRLVFWSFLWQVAQAGASCREAIRQAQGLCRLQDQPVPPDTTSPYCQARGRLPLDRLDAIHTGLVEEAENALATQELWCGHRVRVVDGTTVTLPDTPRNQRLYPQQSVQKPGCGFPIVRLVALFSLATGLISAWASGDWHQHELQLIQQLWDQLRPGEVLLGDRGFCTWGLLAQCWRRGVQAVLRVRGSQRSDWRRGRRLGPDQRLVVWDKRRLCPATVAPAEWETLPAQLSLRLVRCRLAVRGFRTREVLLVTTLLDPLRYPPSALGQLYRRRWEMELTLRHLKTTLQMEHLSCQTPGNVQRELRLHLLVHNLVRRLMLEASRRHRVPLSRISFAGALAAARRYGETLLQARNQRQRRLLMEELLRVVAADEVPDRPGRREPRAVKRRPKPYPRLMRHRHRFHEISHQNRYYLNSPFGPKYRRTSKP
jgi:hypothetical protein